MKIGRVADFGMGNTIMTFIYQIDQIYVNYSYNDDMFYWRSKVCILVQPLPNKTLNWISLEVMTKKVWNVKDGWSGLNTLVLEFKHEAHVYLWIL